MKVTDPYLDDRLRAERSSTFLQFIDELRRLWKEAGKTGDIIRQFPFQEEAQYPVITYRLLRRQISPHFKEYKPRFRDVFPHPYLPDQFVELYGQIFDVLVEFQIFSLSQEEADELVVEFEDFLYLYAGFFKKEGVQDIQFYSQEEDQLIYKERYAIAVRTLQYNFRFEKLTPRFLNQIHDLAVQANVRHTLSHSDTEEEFTW
jgi:hypothetical protein